MKQPQSKLTKDDIRRAKRLIPGDFANTRLYDLCKRYPRHKDLRHSFAKILLIGRVYSAALERGVGPTPELYLKAARVMRQFKLDQLMRGLPNSEAPIAERLAHAVDVHGQLIKMWGRVRVGANGRRARGKRSLASKYLHFHRRDVFPMYDSRAARGIRKATPDARRIPKLAVNSGDDAYRVFCQRYLWLLRYVHRRFGVHLTLRQADRLLLAIADKEKKKKRRRPPR